jgi:tyrosine-protein phosphatase YwqE
MFSLDLHSHLIAGIDDGVDTIEESIEIILELRKLGVFNIITTPHIKKERYPNTATQIKCGLDELRDELRRRKINIQIDVAAEYYADEHFLQLLQAREIMSFGKNYVLFELSYTRCPDNLEDIVDAIKEAGYTPVLAHPERYLYMLESFHLYRRLKEKGVYFQLDINSLIGYYSPKAQKIANALLKEDMIEFVGSDTHKMRHLEALKQTVNTPQFKRLYKSGKIQNNALICPAR